MPSTFSERFAQIQERVQLAALKSGRLQSDVQVIAVAKTATADGLREAWDFGHRTFGHNRVQALKGHFEVLPDGDWHLIGPLQRNKARKAVVMASMVQTVAGLELAVQLDRLAAELRSTPLPILLQVNLTPEDGRAGVIQSEIPELLNKIADLNNLQAKGLMTLGPHHAESDALRIHFATLHDLSQDLQQLGLLPPRPELSMGMSNDYEIAIEEGATLVRIGRALFPPTP